ncbi:MAG TPA: hypothetical protein DDY34_14175 [Bacteroidales bacterium]|nr:hypothetical protein [Bacteroidales bacterium]HCU18954.1 hypothetical protein [Bacteroidales bacterium]
MLQRIQSLFLFLTTLLSLLFLNGKYLTFFDNSGSVIIMSLSEIVKLSGSGDSVKTGEVWILLVLAIMIPLLSLLIIFLFKKRNYQMILTGILILLISIFIGASLAYSFNIISKYDAAFTSWYKLIIPVIQLILSVLAYRGVKKDEDLVKSYDRLR